MHNVNTPPPFWPLPDHNAQTRRLRRSQHPRGHWAHPKRVGDCPHKPEGTRHRSWQRRAPYGNRGGYSGGLGRRGDRSCGIARKLARFPLRVLLLRYCKSHREIEVLVGSSLKCTIFWQLCYSVRRTVQCVIYFMAVFSDGRSLFCRRCFVLWYFISRWV